MSKENELFKNCDYLTPEIARKNGISKARFYKYIHDNELEQVGHGIYIRKDDWVDELL